MKTSYYARYSKLPQELKDTLYPIPISTTVPKWFTEHKESHKFISPHKMLYKYKNGDITWEECCEEYIKYLISLEEEGNLYEYYMEIEREVGKEIVLLCYETSDKPCHRHILADYLNKKYNTNIEEL